MPVLKTARKRKAKEKAVRETRKISISKRVKAKRTISSQDCEIPPTSQTITCRICTDAKSLQELPRDVKTTEPLDSQTKLDIPEACQSHLGVSNPFGPVCKSCITSYLTAAMELKSIWNIGCLHPGCSEPWPEHFIILYLHGTPKLDLYHRKKLEWFIAQNPNFVWCSNPNCEAGGIMDKTAIGFPKVACDACKTRSCALCRVAWHEGVTCQEFRESHQHVTGEEQKALEFLAKKGYKRCPRCQFAIQKSEGCNNMWCGNCYHNFNYGSIEKVRAPRTREILPRKAKEVAKTRVSTNMKSQQQAYGGWRHQSWWPNQLCEADALARTEAQIAEASTAST